MNFVGQWWVHRLALYIVDSLWSSSFHAILPMAGPDGTAVGDWVSLRKLFITSLLCRGRSEIELWPSQIDAAKRVLEYDANLVLSLPTSAGKTRIAELCILACLAAGKRVVFVTLLACAVCANRGFAAPHVWRARQERLKPLWQHRRQQ
jgi:hypothetical protein